MGFWRFYKLSKNELESSYTKYLFVEVDKNLIISVKTPLPLSIRHEMTSYATLRVDVRNISSNYEAENP